MRLIQRFYAAGLPSRVIREMLPCMDSGDVTSQLLERLAAERDRIDRQARELLEVRDRLDDLIATAERPGPGCTRVDA